MDSRLPLAIRVALRDCWDDEAAPVRAARKGLEEVLGLPVRIEPEWAQLVHELEPVYGDDKKKNLVVAVAGCVELWCKILTEVLDDADRAGDAQQQWVETLLERVSPGAGLRLYLAVAPSAGTSWTEASATFGAGFVVSLPRQAVVYPEDLRPAYRAQLLQCFADDKDNAKKPSSTASSGDGRADGPRAAAPGDDWTDVQVGAEGAAVVGLPTTATAYLPSAASLPSPDMLLLRPPYHLTVLDYGAQTVEVQCSHSPTLEFLSTYLQRWCRINYNNATKPPAVEVTLHQSVWATGPCYDRLTLSTEEVRYNYKYTVNTTIVLALVEGILGYTRVSDEGGRVRYRRDVVFKG